MTVRLSEVVAEAPVKTGKRWRVVVARPGQGSSGKYSPELLETYGPLAIPAGTRSFLGHDTPDKRNLKDLVGSYPDGAFWDATMQELVAELEPFPHWQSVVDALGPFAEASIYLSGTKDEEGNVLTLEPHRTNSVDLVAFAGLEGSGLKEQVESLVESARSFEKNPTVTVAGENGKIMEELLKELKSTLDSFINDSKAKAKDELQVEADTQAAERAAVVAVEAYDARIAAIEAARDSLLPSQVESIRQAAKVGQDVAPLIESAKKVFEEAKATMAEADNGGGRMFGAAETKSAIELGKVL